MSQNDEEAQRLIEDQFILIDLLREEIADLKASNRMKDLQIQSLMKNQKVNYEVG